jgi:hypothetical protein
MSVAESVGEFASLRLRLKRGALTEATSARRPLRGGIHLHVDYSHLIVHTTNRTGNQTDSMSLRTRSKVAYINQEVQIEEVSVDFEDK